MPDLPLIPRMDKTLHPCLQKDIEKQKDIFQQVLRNKWCFQKSTKTKMTAMPRSIDLKPPRTIFIGTSIKIEGLGTNRYSIMHPYF